jgi:hypothetical protein
MGARKRIQPAIVRVAHHVPTVGSDDTGKLVAPWARVIHVLAGRTLEHEPFRRARFRRRGRRLASHHDCHNSQEDDKYRCKSLHLLFR